MFHKKCYVITCNAFKFTFNFSDSYKYQCNTSVKSKGISLQYGKYLCNCRETRNTHAIRGKKVPGGEWAFTVWMRHLLQQFHGDMPNQFKGSTIWFWGVGGGGGVSKFCRDRLFIFSISPAGKIIFRYTKARIFIFTRKKNQKQKKTKTKQKQRWGRNVDWFRREAGQDFPCDFFISLQTTAYSVC